MPELNWKTVLPPEGGWEEPSETDQRQWLLQGREMVQEMHRLAGEWGQWIRSRQTITWDVSGLFRGSFVRWETPGQVVEGMVTFLDLDEGCFDRSGVWPEGMLQVFDESNPDGGEDAYRRISLDKKTLRSVVGDCLRDGLTPGGYIRVAYVEDIPNKKPNLHPWKRFEAQWAERDADVSDEQVEAIVAGGRNEPVF